MNPLSRRTFLAGAGAAALVTSQRASAALSITPEAANGPMGLPPGIQLYGVGKPLAEDTAGTLKLLRQIGYREVETAGTTKHSAKEFRAMLDDAGLTCPSAHLPLAEPTLDLAFANANALGAHYAVSGSLNQAHYIRLRKQNGEPGDPTRMPTGLGGFVNIALKMNEVGKQARAAGLQYAYHNHNFEFEQLPDGRVGYDVLLQQTDPELVKFEIDCGWMKAAGYDPVAYLAKYPGRFRMLHIKDFKPLEQPTLDTQGPKAPYGADLGTGFVDYKPIFAAGKSAGIEHIFIEQEAPYPVSEMDSAKADYAALMKLA